MEIKGRIFEIGEVKQITEKLSVQQFKLDCTRYNPDTGDEYENYVEFQVINKKVDLSKFQKEERVTVHFNPQGRFFDKKDSSEKGFAQNLNCFKVEKV